jgi:hypothetical protein
MTPGGTAYALIAGLRASTLLVSVVLSTILIAANSQPQFPAKASTHSTVSATSHVDQRLRFEGKETQWTAGGGVRTRSSHWEVGRFGR